MLEFKNTRIFIKPGVTDMRKQINGLAVIAQEVMQEDPLSGCLFVFCNRSRNRLKILYWDKTGFCLWLKRLEKEKFPWPRIEEGKRSLKPEELKMVLSGIDFFNAHESITFSSIG